MKLTPSLRKPIVDGYDDEKLIQFYKLISKKEDILLLWNELDARQKQVIKTASEVEEREKALKALESMQQ